MLSKQKVKMKFLIFFSVEIQVKEMTLGDESGVDYSSADNYQSVDSKRFNNKLNIDTDYAEIGDKSFSLHDFQEPPMQNYAEVCKNKNQNIAYATVDLAKKKEERLKKRNAELIQNNLNPETIYEDIGDGKMVNEEKESNIYEMVSSLGEYSEVEDRYESVEYTEPL